MPGKGMCPARFFLFAALIFLASSGEEAAQAQTLEIVLAPNELTSDDVVSLQALLRGVETRPSSPPRVSAPNFVVETLPPREGRGTPQGILWRYLLVPVRGGTSWVEVSIAVQGQLLRREAIVRVLDNALPTGEPGRRPSRSALEDLTGRRFVRADLDKMQAFVHEQLTYRFRYFFENWLASQEAPQYALPTFRGFFSRKLESKTEGGATRERMGGREYYVEEIRLALFPLSAGRLTIPPTRLVLPAVGSRRGPELYTDALSVIVRSLPKPMPEDFSGGVGEFRLQAEVAEVRGHVGKPLRLRVMISGRGNLETLTDMPPPRAQGAHLYEPTVSDVVDVVDGRLGGIRTYEYVLVPQKVGRLGITVPSLVTFSPSAASYRRSEAVTLSARVAPGKAGLRDENEAQPIPLWRWALRFEFFWLALIGLALVLIWRARWQRSRPPEKEGALPSPNGRAVSGVGRIADFPLKEASQQLDVLKVGDGRKLCRDAGDLLRRFCAPRLGLPPGEATSSRILPLLESLGTPEASRMASLIRTCEEGEFAPVVLSLAEQGQLLSQARQAVRAFK